MFSETCIFQVKFGIHERSWNLPSLYDGTFDTDCAESALLLVLPSCVILYQLADFLPDNNYSVIAALVRPPLVSPATWYFL